LPNFGNNFTDNNSGETFLKMFHVEHAKNQKSAKIQNCGFFGFREKIKKNAKKP
jgi:hypothetical protein